MTKDLRVSLVQFNIVWENPDKNLSLLDSLLLKASPDTDLIILPEMFNTGFTMATETLAETMDGPTVQWMQQKAKEFHTSVMGSLIIKDKDKIFNRLLCCAADGIINYYDKRHLFRIAGEDKKYTPGNQRRIIRIKDWKILPLICYDIRFPVWSRVNENEYDIIVYVANWPQFRNQHWEILLKARAIENQAFAIGVNRTGRDENHIDYAGNSMVVHPKGQMLCNLEDKQSINTCVLSRKELDDYREKFPVWKDRDRFEIRG
ncbi:MAG: amidohydrolase [Calditrichaceae bacterium]|nr:amidohydrolase [Calditrichaceae bacterium]MBN2708426.1 amidohydrolase [Calditrichaceae bacterium]RQV93146.1 MAG: amidohydrolase [Calditrichota bacterium]